MSTTIRLLSPEATATINAALQAAVDNARQAVRKIAAACAAQADQRRRELDDELDWLGDYRGRRG